jgi:hypothetical protein
MLAAKERLTSNERTKIKECCGLARGMKAKRCKSKGLKEGLGILIWQEFR